MKDSGHAAIELSLAAGLLLLPAALAVLSFGPWSEARVATEAAAAEASRAAVISLNTATGMEVLDEMAINYGVEPSDVRLGWCGAEPSISGAGGCPMVRGTDVVAEVQMYTPLFSTPWGQVGGLWVTASHSEPVDLYRSLP